MGRIAELGMLELLAVAVVRLIFGRVGLLAMAVVRLICGGVGLLVVAVVRLICHILAPLDSRMPHIMIIPFLS